MDLSAGTRACISRHMSSSVLGAAGVIGVLVATLACDVRPLRQDQLTGGRDAAARPDAAGDIDGEGARGDGDPGTDGASDVSEVNPGCPATPCEMFETCDLPTMTCVLRTGPGMLSGSVTDACTGQGLDARVGIAGRRMCSSDGKGSYYFSGLPEGNLALIAFKDGYKHVDVAVSINATGTIRSIVMHPDTPRGCADPRPADVACVCDIPGCP